MAELSPAEIDVAAAFFARRESDGFVIVGGAALLALELIDRPTEDLDVFTGDPTRISNAAAALTEGCGAQRLGCRGAPFDIDIPSPGDELWRSDRKGRHRSGFTASASHC